MYLKTLVLFLAVFLSEYCDGVAPKNYFRNDYRYIERFDSFYKLHPMQMFATWLGAKRQCALEGGSLFYPDDENEAREVISLLTNSTTSSLRLHVGMSDFLEKEVYKTIEGKPITDVFNNWEKEKPTRFPEERRCVTLKREGTIYSIRDYDCREQHVSGFICRKRQSTVEWNLSCNMPDPNYKHNSLTGNCYKLHKTPLDWASADAVCRAEHSYLAVLNSYDEAMNLVALWQYIQQTHITDNQTVHLGFNLLSREWKTVKGDTLNNGYAPWSPGHPTGEGRVVYGAMLPNGNIIDVHCSTKSAFICEHDVSFNRTANVGAPDYLYGSSLDSIYEYSCEDYNKDNTPWTGLFNFFSDNTTNESA